VSRRSRPGTALARYVSDCVAVTMSTTTGGDS
jgi:hypothetical protein